MTWVVVGLGNPGKEYASHRHNVGFMVADELARTLSADDFRSKFNGEWTRAAPSKPPGAEECVILKPQTFMNVSGQSAQPAAAFFKIDVQHVLVIHDELDIPFGECRLKQGGGHAGHNGLRSLIERFGSNDFARLRVGIGRPPAGFRGEVADFVLSSFSSDERIQLDAILKRAVGSVLDVLARGLGPATNTLHTGPAKPKKQG
jgi:PTH1 family peptidyl-tRNA hydrolase